jgi:hypothetical protein
VADPAIVGDRNAPRRAQAGHRQVVRRLRRHLRVPVCARRPDCLGRRLCGLELVRKTHARHGCTSRARLSKPHRNAPEPWTRGRGNFPLRPRQQLHLRQVRHDLEEQQSSPISRPNRICYDNAMAESFFATLKNERTHRTEYPTRELPATSNCATILNVAIRDSSTEPHSKSTMNTRSDSSQREITVNKLSGKRVAPDYGFRRLPHLRRHPDAGDANERP